MWKGKRWMAIALSAAMTVTAVPQGSVTVHAEEASSTSEFTGDETVEGTVESTESGNEDTQQNEGSDNTVTEGVSDESSGENNNDSQNEKTEDSSDSGSDTPAEAGAESGATEETSGETASENVGDESNNDSKSDDSENSSNDSEGTSSDTESSNDGSSAENQEENSDEIAGTNSDENSTDSNVDAEEVGGNESTEPAADTIDDSLEDFNVEPEEELSDDLELDVLDEEATAMPEFTDGECLVHLDFDSEVADSSSRDLDVTNNNAQIVTDDKMVGDGALKLTRDAKSYLDIKTADGKNPLYGADKITINYFSKTPKDDFTSWAMFAAKEDVEPSYKNEHYFGIMDAKADNGKQLVDIERYDNNNSNRPESIWIDEAHINEWKMVTVVADTDSTSLYINGEFKKKVASDKALTDIFAEDGIFRIGRANWSGGEYSDMIMDDFSIYYGAYSQQQIASMYTEFTGKEVVLPVQFNKGERLVRLTFDEDITDSSSRGIVTTAPNSYEIVNDDKKVGDGALKLTKEGENYIDLKTSDGINPLYGVDKITINYFSKTPKDASPSWAMFAAKEDVEPAYKYEHYFGIIDTKLSDGKELVDVERYDNNNNRPDTTYTDDSHINEWKMVTVVADTDSTSLYINGELKKKDATDISLRNIFSKNGILRIGRSNWGGGEYSNLLLDDFTIYYGAFNESEIASLYENYNKPVEDESLLAYLSFDDEVNGFSSADAKAEKKNSPALVDDGVKGKALSLDKNKSQWLALTKADGSALLSGVTELSINYWSNTDNNAGTQWAFFAAPSDSEQKWPNEKYLGITDAHTDHKNLVVERYNNNGQRSPIAKADTSKFSSKWKMVTVVNTADQFKVYINGVLAATQSSSAALADVLGSEGIVQIGKANWKSGEYSTGLFDEFSIYNRALGDEEIKKLYEDNKPEEHTLGLKAVDVEVNLPGDITVRAGEDYSLVENSRAKITFNNNTSKDDAVVAWYDEEGDRVTNTKNLEVGTYKLTGKLSYFGNPVVPQKADPYVIYNDDDGYYYMTSSWPAYYNENGGYDRVALRRSKTLAGLAEAEDVTVWNAHESGELSHHIWAPELHKIGSDWYVYFSACSDGGVWNIRPYVLHCTDSKDLMNPEKWEEKGRFLNKDGGFENAFDVFSLDMTTFTNGDKSYVIWAYKPGASLLKMAELNTEEPWKLASDPIILSEPEYSWEINGGQKIDEGPAVLKKDGKIYVTFSGSTTGPEYCMGMLTASADADLMDPASWTKNPKAVLQTSDLEGQYGPGHNSFTVDKDGNIIVVYHARDEKCYRDQCEWANVQPLYDPCRNANMAILRFDENNSPYFKSTEEVEMAGLDESKKTYSMTLVVGNSEDKLNADVKELAIPNLNDIRGNITLPESGKNGSVITWESSSPEVISDKDNGNFKMGVVNRTDKDESVTLTATVAIDGVETTKTFEATVKAKAAQKNYTHYLFAYFTGEGSANGEQIYFADSNDGVNWSALNMGDPVIESTLGEKGLRDPFIIRSPEGDKFYLIATDLKVYGNGDWGRASSRGSKSIMIWESTDLVNWGEQRMVEVADPTAGCTWAPEAFYDEESGEYIVFWASLNNRHRIWYSTTRDFYTFSEPQIWIELKNKNGDIISVIDTSVNAVDNADGTKTYYRISKNEESSNAAVDDGDSNGGKYIMLEKASSLRGEWTRIHSDYLNNATGVEGCTMFKFNGEDRWCLLLDKYGAGGYYPSVTTNIESGEFTRLNNNEYKFPSTMRHGTVINITDEEYATLEKKWGNHDSEIEYDTTLAQSAIAHITFDDEEEGFSGNGAAVTANNGYELTEGKFGKAVKLSARDKQFFNLTREDGTSLLTGLDEFAISYWSKSNSSSGTTWSFYAAPDEKAQSSPSEKYIGIIDPLNDSKIHVERYFNGRSNNNDLSMSGLNDNWKMVTVVFFNNATKLYVNGELVSTVSSKADITDLLGENSIIQLGKANWGTGEYSNISLDELAIFNRPVNSDEVKAIYEGTVDYTLNQDDPNEDPNNQDDPNEDPGNQDDPNKDPDNQDNPGEDPNGQNDPGQESGNQDKPAQESGNQNQPSGNQNNQGDNKETPEAQTDPSGQEQNQSQTGATSEENKKVDTEKTSNDQPQTITDEKTPTTDKVKSKTETVKSVKGKLKLVKLKNKKKVYRLKLKNGKYAKGLVKYQKKLYYFDKKGNAAKGFHKVKGKKIYTSNKGKLAIGFKIIGGSTYYFNKDGSMFTGKLKRGILTYHFGKNGKLKKITRSKKSAFLGARAF